MTGMRAFVFMGRRRLLVLILLLCSLVGCATPGKDGMRHGTNSSSGLSSAALFALSAKADSAYRAQRWPEAASHYQQLTDAVPNDAWSWFRLGNIRTQQGQYGAAIQAYSVSIGREGKTAKPWFNLSTVYLLNARKALVQAEQLLAPGDPAAVSIRMRIEAIDAALPDTSINVSAASFEQGESGGIVPTTSVDQFSAPASGWTRAGSGLPER